MKQRIIVLVSCLLFLLPLNAQNAYNSQLDTKSLNSAYSIIIKKFNQFAEGIERIGSFNTSQKVKEDERRSIPSLFFRFKDRIMTVTNSSGEKKKTLAQYLDNLKLQSLNKVKSPIYDLQLESSTFDKGYFTDKANWELVEKYEDGSCMYKTETKFWNTVTYVDIEAITKEYKPHEFKTEVDCKTIEIFMITIPEIGDNNALQQKPTIRLGDIKASKRIQ